MLDRVLYPIQNEIRPKPNVLPMDPSGRKLDVSVPDPKALQKLANGPGHLLVRHPPLAELFQILVQAYQPVTFHPQPLIELGRQKSMQLRQQFLLQSEPLRKLFSQVRHGRPAISEGRLPTRHRLEKVVGVCHPGVV
jgi:hypothetical protein